MGLLEDKLAQATEGGDKRSGDDKVAGRGGSSLGSIMKNKIRAQQQQKPEEDEKK